MMRVATVAALAVLFISIPANGMPECFRSAGAAHRAYGGYVSWTRGRHGEKCWFPVDKHHRIYAKVEHSHVDQLADRRSLKAEVVGAKPTMASNSRLAQPIEHPTLTRKVDGLNPSAAAIETIRTRLEEWYGIMTGNEYVSKMWP